MTPRNLLEPALLASDLSLDASDRKHRPIDQDLNEASQPRPCHVVMQMPYTCATVHDCRNSLTSNTQMPLAEVLSRDGTIKAWSAVWTIAAVWTVVVCDLLPRSSPTASVGLEEFMYDSSWHNLPGSGGSQYIKIMPCR